MFKKDTLHGWCNYSTSFPNPAVLHTDEVTKESNKHLSFQITFSVLGKCRFVKERNTALSLSFSQHCYPASITQTPTEHADVNIIFYMVHKRAKTRVLKFWPINSFSFFLVCFIYIYSWFRFHFSAYFLSWETGDYFG